MLRRITLSVALATCMGVAAAQTVPNLAWSLPAPRSVPSIEWSDNGAYILLTNDSGIELINGKTYKLIWSRQVSGAEPSIAATYGSDRANFPPANPNDIWVRTGPGSTFTEIASSTGAVVASHSFTDWTTDYLLLPVGGHLAAYNIVDSGGTYTLNLRAYNTTFKLLFAKSFTHLDSAGLSQLAMAFGTSASTDYLCFFNQKINLASGAVTTVGTASQELWPIAVDPSGGFIEQIMNKSGSTYTSAGIERVSSTGTVSWSSATSPFTTFGPVPNSTVSLQTTNTTTNVSVASYVSGSSISAFDWLTGSALWGPTTVPYSTFTFSPGAVSIADGRWLAATGNGGYTALDYGVVGPTALGSFTALNAVLGGISGAEPYSGGVLIDGNTNYLSSYTNLGVQTWAQGGNTAPQHPKPSPSGTYAALAQGTTASVINTSNGSVFSTLTVAGPATFVGFTWISDSEFVAVKSDDTALLIGNTSGTLSIVGDLPAEFHVGYAATSDQHYLVSYENNNVYVLDLTNLQNAAIATSYPQYASGWDDFFRIVPTNDGRVALLEETSSGAQWSVYHIASGSLVLDTSYTYSAPFSMSQTGVSLRGDITADLSIVSFFVTEGLNGLALTGAPDSELTVLRTADNANLALYDNQFSYLSSLRISPDHSTLFAVTGNGGALSDEAGPQDLQAIGLPVGPKSLVLNPSQEIWSGKTQGFTLTLSGPAKAGGQKVNLTLTGTGPAMTVPATVTVAAGATSVNFTLTMPTVDTVTPYYTLTASVTGLPGTAAVQFFVRAPVLASMTFSPNGVVGGASDTITVNMTGKVLNDTVITLTENNTIATIPSSVTIAAGTSATSFVAPTQGSIVQVDDLITATQGTTSTTSKTLVVSPTGITSVVMDSPTVVGSQPIGFTITVAEPAPPQKFSINLSSNNSTVFGLNPTATVQPGDTTVHVTGTSAIVASNTTATITCTLGTIKKTATVTATPILVSSLVLDNATIHAGDPIGATITIGIPAPTGGITLNLTSTNANFTLPTTVTFPAGATSEHVTGTSAVVGTTQTGTIKATYLSESASAVLTALPVGIASFVLDESSVTGGDAIAATITLATPAPSGGITVALSSNNAAVSLPSSVTIASGGTTAVVVGTTTPVATATTNAKITATFLSSTASATITVNPPTLLAVTFAQHNVAGGSSVEVDALLSGPTASGAKFTLSSNSASLVAPATQTLTAGAALQTFDLSTGTVTVSTPATLSVTYNGVTLTDTLTIKP